MRVLPDACTDIVWRAATWATVAGPDTGPWFSPTQSGELIVGVRFLPGAGGAALGIPLDELRDQRIELRELGHRWEPADERSAARDLAALSARLVAGGPPDRLIQAAVSRLLHPGTNVADVAMELGLSERQLRRRFRAGVGYGPRTLQRVLRLRRALRSSEPDLARLAAEAGFADQPHMTREFRRLVGMTPADWRRGLSA